MSLNYGVLPLPPIKVHFKSKIQVYLFVPEKIIGMDLDLMAIVNWFWLKIVWNKLSDKSCTILVFFKYNRTLTPNEHPIYFITAQIT